MPSPSVFSHIGTIAERIREAAERTGIFATANGVGYPSAASHATQLIRDCIFGQMKPRLILRREIRFRFGLLFDRLIHTRMLRWLCF
jgi:hypothetical protein